MILDPANADPFPSDVYSLGKTLWVLATGLSYPPEGHQPAATRSFSINDLRPHPHVGALDRLVDRATRLHAEEWPTMQEMADDLAAWDGLGGSPVTVDVSLIGADLRRRLEDQIAAEDLADQRRELAFEAARKLQGLVQPLNDALQQVMPRAEIGLSGEASALLHSPDAMGREVVAWRWDRTSRISAGQVVPLDFSFGVGLDLTESGNLVFRCYVLVARRAVMGNDFFWQPQPGEAPVGSVAADRMLEDGVAGIAAQFKAGLEVFVKKAAEVAG